MLSRRLALAGPALAAISRTTAAQYRSTYGETDIVLLSADGQATSVQMVNDIVAHIGSPNAHLHAEPGRSVTDSARRLADRPMAVAAVLPSVALAYMPHTGLPEHVVYTNRFIGRMGVCELHVLASQRVSNLRDLVGQKVAVGPPGSSTQATAAVLLERASLRVEPVYLSDEEAVTAVVRGQIPAMVLLAAKPARPFFNLNLSDGVHFLPVSMPGGKPIGLFSAQIQPADYPLLSGGEAGVGRAVATVGVPLVLACYNLPPATPMFMGLARLADLLIRHGSGLRGFDMTAEVPGWQRFPLITAWLANNGRKTVEEIALTQRRLPATGAIDTSRTSIPADAQLTKEQKEQLLQQFLEWRRRH
jgi:NMT1-like family